MIIFDIDNVLSDCSHRMHLVDRKFAKCKKCGSILPRCVMRVECTECEEGREQWKQDWPAFHEACDKDESIEQCISIFKNNYLDSVHIWSSRCESTREKTLLWLEKHVSVGALHIELKMRPIGNTEPAHVLKERWLDELCENITIAEKDWKNPISHNIEMAFDSDPESIATWKRRGIFVFDCRQSNE